SPMKSEWRKAWNHSTRQASRQHKHTAARNGMAAYSKAAKIKAKRSRGRPKKEGVMREPNGRRSRAKEHPAKAAIDARMRIFNLTKDQAMDQKAATNLGRLAMMGRADGLSQDQYEAALRYLDVRNDYQKSLLSPGAYFEPNGSVDTSDP